MRVGRFVLAKRAESRVFTVPNALTASRLLCAPLLGKAIVFGETPAAVAILGFAAFTDVADGWIARRWNQQSDLGSYLDPVADKVLATVACVALGSAGLLPPALVGLILVRDFTLAQGTAWHLYRTARSAKLPVKLDASWLSKSNTVLQIGLFGCALVGLDSAVEFLVPIVAATTWVSGFQYYLSNPLKSLKSRDGITEKQERFGQSVNTLLVSIGFGLFMWCVFVKENSPRKKQ